MEEIKFERVDGGFVLGNYIDELSAAPNVIEQRVVVSRDGVPLRVYDTGGTLPVLVIIIPGGIPAGVTHAFIHQLARHFRVISWDSRGYPSVSDNFDDIELEVPALLNDLADILEHSQIRACHLVGICAGCAVAVRAFGNIECEFNSLVLISGSLKLPGGTHHTPAIHDSQGKLNPLLQMSESRAKATKLLPIVRTVALNPEFRYFRLCERPERLQKVVDLVFSNPEYAYRFSSLLRANAEQSVFDSFHRILAPTLVVVAKDDVIASPLTSEYLASHIEDAVFIEYPDGGHFMLAEKPVVADDITSFLLRVLDGASTSDDRSERT